MPQLSWQEYERMCLRANVVPETLNDALRRMGPSYLKTEQMRSMWKPERPTINFCYVVSEFVYWYSLRNERDILEVRHCKVDNLPGITHWYLQANDLIDLTGIQFDNYSDVRYDQSKRGFFFQSAGPGPSKRAKVLAAHMGYEVDYWCGGSP